jgi:hypothetical protein
LRWYIEVERKQGNTVQKGICFRVSVNKSLSITLLRVSVDSVVIHFNAESHLAAALALEDVAINTNKGRLMPVHTYIYITFSVCHTLTQQEKQGALSTASSHILRQHDVSEGHFASIFMIVE